LPCKSYKGWEMILGYYTVSWGVVVEVWWCISYINIHDMWW